MTEAKRPSLPPILDSLCATYNYLFQQREVAFPLLEMQKRNLESIIKTVEADYFNHVPYPTVHKKAAIYFYLIIKNHPVIDGNKRLAVLWLELFCQQHNLRLNLPSNATLDILAVAVEKTKDSKDEVLKILDNILFYGMK